MGHVSGRQESGRLRLAGDRMFRLPPRVQRPKPLRAYMGGRSRADSPRLFASLVCFEKLAKDVARLRPDLGDLHRVPRPAKFTSPLRFSGAGMETAFVRLEDNRVR